MSTSTTTPPPHRRLERFLLVTLVFFVVQSVYIGTRATPNLFYPAMVLLHAFGGAVLLVPFVGWVRARLRIEREAAAARAWTFGLGTLLMAASGVLAVALIVVGNTRPHRWVLHAHIATAIPAALLLLVYAALRAGAGRTRTVALPTMAVAIALPLVLGFGAPPDEEAARHAVIRNPPAPLSMDGESMGGAQGPFYPSSASTSTRGRIPSTFFMTSETCGASGCHPDIVAQWRSSMHRHSSFNNQWYRKSIEYMQSVVGVQPSKWCAGCHDLAVLFNGMFDKPVTELVDTAEANVGLACTACHSITHVRSTMGQGDYEIEYPPLHDLAASQNPFLRLTHDAFVRVDPDAHRETFLKPFHTDQRAEFCSSCHKVHLDVPVNSYRWFRGFNDYDAWQASGVSGMGARSFYYPPKSMDCVDCHMPLVPSKDKGNLKGMVHSHSFPAANTAMPTANGDTAQLELVKAFLRKRVTVDIFALSREPEGDAPAGAEAGSGAGAPEKPAPATAEPKLASTFAVGEEGGNMGAAGIVRDRPIDVTAPIDVTRPAVRPGESVRVDVVVRTRAVGHFFPGGTVDAFDVWVELKGEDARGRTVFWSGRVEDEAGGRKGPVEKGAHFYRALLVDANGNPIDKRNAWSARAAVYVRLIPPGAADTVHYRIRIPEDVAGPIKLTARLNYRKFSYFNTNFAYAGVPDPADTTASVGKDHDDRSFVFTGSTAKVSGKLKAIPDLPIVEIDSTEATLDVVPAGAPLPPSREAAASAAAPAPGTPAPPSLRERWNDYGIGLLLQGDLRAAVDAFERVTRIEPGYADGWVNIARVRLREGDTAKARAALAAALKLDPKLARAHYFAAVAAKDEGDYEGALVHLEETARQFPKDRVVLNDAARIHFLRRDYAQAIAWTDRVLAIDPEDLTAHYTRMLAFRGLGDTAGAERSEALYRRFKADEDAPIRTGEYRRTHPEDNNERQPIHEHVSVGLGSGA